MGNVYQFPNKGQRRRRQAKKAFTAGRSSAAKAGRRAQGRAAHTINRHPGAVFAGTLALGNVALAGTGAAVQLQARHHVKKQRARAERERTKAQGGMARASNPQGSRRGGGHGRQRRDSHGRFA